MKGGEVKVGEFGKWGIMRRNKVSKGKWGEMTANEYAEAEEVKGNEGWKSSRNLKEWR